MAGKLKSLDVERKFGQANSALHGSAQREPMSPTGLVVGFVEWMLWNAAGPVR